MKNMADAIESFIVGQLLAASKNTVLVQRNELQTGYPARRPRSVTC